MSREIATNKKARREFHITDKFECGIELRGTEVKSIRDGKANIADAFARIDKGQLYLYGCNIQPWQTAGEWFQHETKRPRRLLMHRREILKLEQLTLQKGFSLPCLRMYLKNQKVKVELGLGKGKTHADQRHDLKKSRDARGTT